MSETKPSFLRRTIAYIIDLLIVTLLVGILSTILIKDNNYVNESQKLMQLYQSYAQGEITREAYNKEYESIDYYFTKDSVGVNIINVSISLIYFVGLCFYCGGVTLGKRIMRLKIVSSKDKELHLGNYLVRGLFINLILSKLLEILMVTTLNKETFTVIHSRFGNVLSIFVLATVVVMMYRDDGRGVHDLLAGTKIISTKKEKEEVKEDVVEAKVIEEKKTTKKRTTKKDVK